MILLLLTLNLSLQQPNVIRATVYPSGANPQPGITAGWQKMVPYRDGYFNPQLGKLLSDIESQLDPNHIYRHEDRTIWAHEATHGINSRARQALPQRWNAFYCFNKRCFVISEPNVTKSQVAEFIPRSVQGQSYNLYVKEPTPPPGYETWENQPLHLIDEYTAYLNGLEVSQQLNLRVAPDSDLWHAVELAGYAGALVRCIEKYDASYVHKDKLIEYINYCNSRTGHYMPSATDQRIKSLAQAVKGEYGNENSNARPTPASYVGQ